MDAPLNLTPERGPSVWVESRRELPWATAAIAGGSALTAYAWNSRSPLRPLIAGLGMSGIVLGLFANGGSQRLINAWQRLACSDELPLDPVDLASKHSFPASDPPAAW